jgi:hypothetical protein
MERKQIREEKGKREYKEMEEKKGKTVSILYFSGWFKCKIAKFK